MNSIRPYHHAEDYSYIELLLNQLWTHELGDIKARIQRASEKPNYILLVYETDDGVVAFMCMHLEEVFWAPHQMLELDILIVDEAHRNNHVGQELLEYVQQVADEYNCPYIKVESGKERTDAHRFYEKHGYTIEDYIFYKKMKKDEE